MPDTLSEENIDKKNSILGDMHSSFQHISDREGLQTFSDRWSQFYTKMSKAENISFLSSELTSFEMEIDDLTRNIFVEEIGHMRMGLQELRKLI